MKFKNIILAIIALHVSFCSSGQNNALAEFPELVITNIPGAPKLGNPTLIISNDKEVTGLGHGLAAPAVWDWDRDGVKDLLIGEFGTGLEFGRYIGNFIRVYQNVGTESKPEFSGQFFYARPPFRFPGNGTPLSVDQYCCMGFAPQFVDLNGDGYKDMITGQYQGEVSWFQGNEEGFMPGEPLIQEGNPRDPNETTFMYSQPYWLYSSASFGDFTNDGLQDLIVGGKSLRISKNIGTSYAPAFAKRELLLDVDGNPLKVYNYSPDELEKKQKLEADSRGISPVPVAGDDHVSPYVVDWDQDGILDLLVTNSYTHKGLPAISFFKGVLINNQHQFHKGIPLFTAKGEDKAFPGSALRVFVTDWNNDGVNDLLIGASVVTVRDVFNKQLSWLWEDDCELSGAGKDPGLIAGSLTKNQLQEYKKDMKPPPGITIEDYITIRHRGYIYVMLGRKNEASLGNEKKTDQ
jgi:hypothetical protein